MKLFIVIPSFSVILLLSTTTFVKAQDVDSLYAAFERSGGKEHIRIANELSQLLVDLGHISTYTAFTEKDSKAAIDAFVAGSVALFKADHADYAEGIILNKKSLVFLQELCDSAKILQRLQNLYVNYASIGEYDKALECLEESLKIATATNNRAMLANTLLCLGNLHSHSNTKLAIESIEKGLIIERELNDTRKIIWALTSLVSLNLELDNTEKAEEYVDEAYMLAEKDNIITMKMECWAAKGLIHKKKAEWDKAINYFDTVLVESRKNKYPEYDIIALSNLGDIYMQRGKNRQKAEEYYLQAAKIGEETSRQVNLCTIYEKLYEINRADNKGLALEYLEKAIKFKEIVQQEETEKQINDFHVRYGTLEKQLEIERQQHIIERHSVERIVFIAGLVLTVVILVLVWRMLRYRIKRNRALAEMNATKDKFFSIISHDLKNPAVAQRDALLMLQKNLGKWDTKTLSDFYSELLKSADSQVELLYNLLGWAQLQTGRMTYAPEPFDIVPKLRSEAVLITKMADQKGVALKTDLPEEALVSGDKNMLATVVRNLLTNAVKFTPAGGEVVLSASIGTQATTITIADNGVGMTAEQVRNLFRIDSNQSQRGTAGESGTGLGLVVCNELLEKHGSALQVESEAGKGSRFWFVIK